MRKIIWQRFMDTGGEEQVSYITPAGFLPDDYNIWITHTNFVITNLIAAQLNQVEGLEAIRYYSPYRMKIIIGQAFDTHKVRQKINKLLKIEREERIEDQEVVDNYSSILDRISKPFWAIYIAPNGEIEHCESESLDDIMEEYDLYRDAQNSVGGRIIDWKTSLKEEDGV